MKIFLVNLFFIFQLSVFCQISEQFTENTVFENLNCKGTVGKFIINENEQLQLNDISASGSNNQAYLSLPSESINNGIWELSVIINATTSSGNYVRYYLVSDNDSLSSDLNGYYVMIGNTADEISLYRQTGSDKIKIIDGADARIATSTVDVRVKVTRDEEGNWELFSKLASETDFTLEGSCSDFSIFKSSYSGIFVNYSSGNKLNYYFDDWQVTGEKYVNPYDVQPDDIVFNEIMVKPSPNVALPEAEYIELYNRTDKKINLSGFSITDNGKKYGLENCFILPNSYLLLCSETNLTKFTPYGKCSGMTSFPTLTDAGKLLYFENSEGKVISWVEYSDKWYADDFKTVGGWSLECIDVNNTSNNNDNWHASTDNKGGTPCQSNSVATTNIDVIKPQIVNLSILSNDSIEIFFSESMKNESLSEKQNYEISALTIDGITIQYPQQKSVTIHFSTPISEGNIYEMTLKNMTDKNENLLENATIKFAMPETIEPTDLVINEILFNPLADGVDYVELYNRSNKTLDASNLILTSSENGQLKAGSFLSSTVCLIFPTDYVLLTSDLEKVCNEYTCGENANKIKLSTFPSYPDTEGNVVLTSKNATIIDEFFYSEKMHHAMIKNAEGESLERINPNRKQLAFSFF